MNAPFAKMTKSKSKKSKGINKNQIDIKGKSKSFHPWIKTLLHFPSLFMF
jgi:hypothetical protein